MDGFGLGAPARDPRNHQVRVGDGRTHWLVVLYDLSRPRSLGITKHARLKALSQIRRLLREERCSSANTLLFLQDMRRLECGYSDGVVSMAIKSPRTTEISLRPRPPSALNRFCVVFGET